MATPQCYSVNRLGETPAHGMIPHAQEKLGDCYTWQLVSPVFGKGSAHVVKDKSRKVFGVRSEGTSDTHWHFGLVEKRDDEIFFGARRWQCMRARKSL